MTEMDASQCKTLVLGLGNTILTDDGVGIYVARSIRRRMENENIVYKEASMGGLELLELMKGFDRAIVIDAIQTGKHEVGSLVKLRIEDLGGGSALARHQVGFQEALELGRKLGMELPEEIAIYGIEVKDILTFGESCTPEVEGCIPQIVETIMKNEFPLKSTDEWGKHGG